MTDNSDEKPEVACLREMIDLENEEKARNLIESGYQGYKSDDETYPSIIGNGEYASRFRAIYGATKKVHLHSQRSIDEERYPEIYPWKRWAKSKQRSNEIPNYDGIDESQRPTHITKQQFIDLYSAVCFANSYGAILNAHITIPWGDLGYTDHVEAADQLQIGFIKPLQDWYKNNVKKQKLGVKLQHDLYWIYSHECSQKKGFHTHFLVGIQSENIAKFKIWVINRLTKLSKIKTANINNRSKVVVAPPSRLMTRQWIRFQYLCKGIDPSATVEIKGYKQPVPLSDLIQFAYSNPGHITCKNRVGSSGNLKLAERKKANFNSLMENGIFDKRVLYPSEIPGSWLSNQNKHPKEVSFSDFISEDDLAFFESLDDNPSKLELTLEDSISNSQDPNKKFPDGEKIPSDNMPTISVNKNFSSLTDKEVVQPKGRQFLNEDIAKDKKNIQPKNRKFVNEYLPKDKEDVKPKCRKFSHAFLALHEEEKEDAPPKGRKT